MLLALPLVASQESCEGRVPAELKKTPDSGLLINTVATCHARSR